MVRIHILSLDGGSIHTIYTATMAYAHWPLAPMANGHWPFCCINRYTSYTHGVKAFQSYTAKSALYSAIQYTAIHRYTLYNLYNTPLRPASCVGCAPRRACERRAVAASRQVALAAAEFARLWILAWTLVSK